MALGIQPKQVELARWELRVADLGHCHVNRNLQANEHGRSGFTLRLSRGAMSVRATTARITTRRTRKPQRALSQ